MLDLSLKWSGKLTDAEVVLGMARGWERHPGLADEFSSGHQGGRDRRWQAGHKAISRASRSLHYMASKAVFHVHCPFGSDPPPPSSHNPVVVHHHWLAHWKQWKPAFQMKQWQSKISQVCGILSKWSIVRWQPANKFIPTRTLRRVWQEEQYVFIY